MKRALIPIVLIFLLFVVTVRADQMSFGSVGNNKRITMIPGETREFKLSFFNYGEQPLVVEIKKTGSDEIKASMSPRYFVLENTKNVINPLGEEEWVVLGDNYIKAVPVHVSLKVPQNISELTQNHHTVKITATARTEESGPSGTREKIYQAREYSYFITIPGNIAVTEEEYNVTLEQYYRELESNESGEENSWKIGVKESEEETDNEGRGQLPTGFFSLGGEEGNSSLYYIIFIIILVISLYFIYRRFGR